LLRPVAGSGQTGPQACQRKPMPNACPRCTARVRRLFVGVLAVAASTLIVCEASANTRVVRLRASPEGDSADDASTRSLECGLVSAQARGVRIAARPPQR